MDKNQTLLFLGDVVPFKAFKFRNDIKTVINLECPITKEGTPEEGKINLRVQENYLGEIFGNNLFCVNIGNNHIMDYGKPGLASTLSELSKLQTNVFGLNETKDDLYNALIVDYNSISIAFISVVCMSTSPLLEAGNGYSLSVLDTNKILEKVSRIRASVKRIVVYIHWGTEESSYPEVQDILTARKLIDGGVDIVIGSHAHAPQPIERYRQGIIAYNLGNFIMPGLRNIPTYYGGAGVPLSTYNKNIMPWNRISWGLMIDMGSMEFKVIKYMFLFDRIVRLLVTPFDSYLKLDNSLITNSDSDLIGRLLRKRALYRRIRDFIHTPHIPEKLKKLL